MLDVLCSLSVLLLMGLSVYGLGRPLSTALCGQRQDPLSAIVWTAAFGLLAAGILLFLLASVGWLGLPAIAFVTLCGVLWASVELTCDLLGRRGGRILAIDLRHESSPGRQARWPVARPTTCRTPHAPEARTPEPPIDSVPYSTEPPGIRWALLLAGGVLVATFCSALAPPTSPEALSRSLDIPKTLLAGGDLRPAWDRGGVNIVQLWFAWAMILDGPVAANLVHWSLGLLTSLAGYVLARPLLGMRSALAVSALVLLCPGVQRQMSSVPVEDLAGALFTTLTLAAIDQMFRNVEGGHWGIVAGAMLGAAMASTLVALAFAIAAVGVWLWISRAAQASDLVRRSPWSLMIATIVVAAPWLAPNSITAPLHAGQSLPSLAAHLGPLLLLGLTSVWMVGPKRELTPITIALIGYSLAAGLLPLGQRWWAILVPLVAVVATSAWCQAARMPNWPRRLAGVIGASLAIACSLPLCDRARDCLLVAIGLQSRHDYLVEREPSYRAASLLNRIHTPHDRLLCHHARTFYFDCPTAQLSDAPSPAPDDVGSEPARLLDIARSHGFSYVLLDQAIDSASIDVQAGPRDGHGTGVSNSTTPIGEVIPILQYQFADDKSRPIRYSLLRLRGSQR